MALITTDTSNSLESATKFVVAESIKPKSALYQLLERGELITNDPSTGEYRYASIQGLDPIMRTPEYFRGLDNLVDNMIYESRISNDSTTSMPDQPTVTDAAVLFFNKAKLHWENDSERMRIFYRLSLAMLLIFDERRTNDIEGEKYQLFKWLTILDSFNQKIGFQNLQEYTGADLNSDFDYICARLKYNPIAKFKSQTLPPRRR